MPYLRIRIDLAIPTDIANKTAVKTKLNELKDLIKQAKAYAIKINEGQPNEEMTVTGNYHVCNHDIGQPCGETIEI